MSVATIDIGAVRIVGRAVAGSGWKSSAELGRSS